MSGVTFSVIVTGSDIKQAAKYSFSAALFASVVVVLALIALPMPIDHITWLLVVLPPLVLCFVWVVVVLFAALLYVGLLLVGKIPGG